MSETLWRDGDDGMMQRRLQSYVNELLRTHKTKTEIEDELMQYGLDREAASNMVTNALDAQWRYDGGGGPALGRVGPRHMIAGALLCAGGVAATFASAHFAITMDGQFSFIFYGAIGAGAIDFAYGLIRFLEG